MHIINTLESNVRSYVRSFPVVFDRALGAELYDEQGKAYIDFFAGAGALNYGHNNPLVTHALIAYLQRNGIVHSLDKATVAKQQFLQTFSDTILAPRKLEYKIQFTGPTGTNAVESALKLARMVKQRSNVIAFTNAYHGLTMGALGITGNDFYQNESYSSRLNVDRHPFAGYLGEDTDTMRYLHKKLADDGSGVDRPAAIIVETIQGEGGINVASHAWLQALETLCRDYDILLIIDDIQMGNGRTGSFFSFEAAGIKPDMVCLSKSIGGGLPMALLLMRPELDQWQPGEHTGTFRGNNLAFVAATQLLRYWQDDALMQAIAAKGKIMEAALQQLAIEMPQLDIKVRGRGMIWGMETGQEDFAVQIAKSAFDRQLLIETCGSRGQVIKFLPPLTIDEALLRKGLERFAASVAAAWQERLQDTASST